MFIPYPLRHANGLHRLKAGIKAADFRRQPCLALLRTSSACLQRQTYLYTMSLSLNGSRRPSPLRPVSSSAYDPMAPTDSAIHPVIHEGRVAVITGAGSGIGRAAAIELARSAPARLTARSMTDSPFLHLCISILLSCRYIPSFCPNSELDSKLRSQT